MEYIHLGRDCGLVIFKSIKHLKMGTKVNLYIIRAYFFLHSRNQCRASRVAHIDGGTHFSGISAAGAGIHTQSTWITSPVTPHIVSEGLPVTVSLPLSFTILCMPFSELGMVSSFLPPLNFHPAGYPLWKAYSHVRTPLVIAPMDLKRLFAPLLR